MVGIEPDSSVRARETAKLYKAPVERGRDARFRIEVVVVAYKHTCALTGYRMTTINMESIVDAAHIHEFKDSRNNDPRNGIALSKNAHWQFDRGLWSITDDYRVIVNKDKFTEAGPTGQRLADYEGQSLLLPEDPQYWPKRVHFDWHRKKHGL
jgi:putative restriction endonuclease